jgi:hypothetical protein
MKRGEEVLVLDDGRVVVLMADSGVEVFDEADGGAFIC